MRYLLTGILLAIVVSTARAVDVLNPDNGHYYRTTAPQAVPWELAKLLAFQQIREDQRGHLVTITSAAEQQFVMANFGGGGGSFWTGGIQPAGSPEPAGNWQWVTGEPFEYSNWYPGGGEPNNVLDSEFVIEAFLPSGYWNDTHLGGVDPWFPQVFQKRWVVEFTPGYEPALDGADFLNWQRTYNRTSLQLGDFDADRRVDADDLALWKTYFGGETPSSSPVPEPGAGLTSLVGVLGVCALRRAKR